MTQQVYAAITAVQGELAKIGIAKEGTNQQQGFKFRGIDQIFNTLAPLLSKHKLCILPRVVSREASERQTQRGGALFYVIMQVEFDLVSAEDGSRHTISTYGEAMDSADKATNKAMSAAYKYACIQAFCIPTEGDNDADHVTHDVQPATVAKPRRPGPVITEAQQNILADLIGATGTDARKFCDHYGVADLDELRVPEFERALRQLQAKADKRKLQSASHAEFLAEMAAAEGQP